MDTVERYLETGISRVILGTAAINDPSFLKNAVKRFGDRIAVGGLQQIIPGVPVKIVTDLPEEKVKKPNIFVRLFRKIKKIIKGNK